MNVSHSLAKWYDLNKRSLPWREIDDPYRIWISEIILQQTRMSQGMDYYKEFIGRFPDIFVLADAHVEEVLMVWQGLGYYSRARNMHKTARVIVEKYDGNFPRDLNLLKQLPGIGDYTAAAIASLAFNIPVASVDGNVYRFLSRYFGIFSFVDSSKGKKEFIEVATEILDRNNPGRHNQSLIELGALICLPRKAGCDRCPLNSSCYALKHNMVYELPKKAKKSKQIDRFLYYLVITKGDRLYIRQRGEKDIWALLYDFPVIEKGKRCDLKELTKLPEWMNRFGKSIPFVKHISGEYKHILSHQLIHAWFIQIEIEEDINSSGIFSVEYGDLKKYPVSRLLDKFLDTELRLKQ